MDTFPFLPKALSSLYRGIAIGSGRLFRQPHLGRATAGLWHSTARPAAHNRSSPQTTAATQGARRTCSASLRRPISPPTALRHAARPPKFQEALPAPVREITHSRHGDLRRSHLRWRDVVPSISQIDPRNLTSRRCPHVDALTSMPSRQCPHLGALAPSSVFAVVSLCCAFDVLLSLRGKSSGAAQFLEDR